MYVLVCALDGVPFEEQQEQGFEEPEQQQQCFDDFSPDGTPDDRLGEAKIKPPTSKICINPNRVSFIVIQVKNKVDASESKDGRYVTDPVVCGLVKEAPDFPFVSLWMHLEGNVKEVKTMPRFEKPNSKPPPKGSDKDKKQRFQAEEKKLKAAVNYLNNKQLGIIVRGLSGFVYPFLDALPGSGGRAGCRS